MEKSPGAFRTISEVADELELPQHVLRFWETKFTQLKPLKRGGKRRYYRPEDITLLRQIKSLLYDDGYTIKGVQKIFRQANISLVESNKTGVEFKAERKVKKPVETAFNIADAENTISDAIKDLENLRNMLRNC
tara:strand:- start:462 stop:863 length:402 start_codon:yes stop_codon:yes gene_type:complete